MKRKKAKALSGYMTVEATLIMPFVIYICVAVIYLGFLQYDRCLMKQDAYRAALRGSSIYKEDNEVVYAASYRAIEEFSKDKYIASDCAYTVEVQGKVRVQVTGAVRMPFRGITALLGQSEWSIQEVAESKCIRPSFFIRTCRMLWESK